MLNRRMLLCGCAAMLSTAADAQPVGPTPSEALARVQDGNRRFRIDDPTRPDLGQSRRTELSRSQRPFVAVLGCADSRAAPETLFRAGLGDVFTVRVAGNSVLGGAVGSLEYAVAALHVPLIIVLGHERCGAVAAANQVVETGVELPGALGALVSPIIPAVIQARRETGPESLEPAARLHARRTAQRLRSGEGILAQAVSAGRLRVEAAYYTLDDGEVSFLPA